MDEGNGMAIVVPGIVAVVVVVCVVVAVVVERNVGGGGAKESGRKDGMRTRILVCPNWAQIQGSSIGV